MAVGLKQPKTLHPIRGVKLATAAANIRYVARDDMVLMTFSEGSNTAAVFTKNKYSAAPVIVAKESIAKNTPMALLINAGNANAGTGELGLDNARASCQQVAEALGCDPQRVLPFSTGVIGEQIPMAKVSVGIRELVANTTEDNWLTAANAIMTTDTVAKGVSQQIEIDGETVTITGIAKGSGMICPNMATMLSYVATDANIESDVLQAMLVRATAASFNRITVDSDTSTNDALTLTATGQSGVSILAPSERDEASELFYSALESVLIELATAVVRDGEGATKFVKIEVRGGGSQQDCSAIAYSIAHSPLVKTALFASDPNWGRILAAIGKADVEQLEISKIDININDQVLIEAGEPASSYTEVLGKAEFEKEEITITVNLSVGSASYHVWTSDLSHEYVSINADYRS